MTRNGQVILITGAGSGMGQLAARNMADAGANIAALDIDEAGLAQTAEGRPGITPLPCDVTNASAVAAAAKQVETEIGPIERVFAAAAIMPTGKLLDQDTATVQRIMDINYGGVVNTVHATLPAMLERGRGDLVLFASMAGWQPVLLLGAYNASKFALSALGISAANELATDGIRVTNIYPGEVETPLLEQRPTPVSKEHRARILQPEDLGEIVVTLASLPQRVHVPELIVKPVCQEYV